MKEKDFREKLSKEQYNILRKKGTEMPGTGKLLHNKKTGMYCCAACGNPLFSSGAKFESGSGWPSFYEAAKKGSVKLQKDMNHGMIRTEVICAKCGSHLGHLFDDAPQTPTGDRYCINSAALNFKGRKR
jgi:peptide-methionine (R)-S-oxide reductase